MKQMKLTELPRWATGFVLPVLNLLSALLVAALVIHLLGESPVESMKILVNSAIVNPEGLAYTLFYASTFIFTGLAVSIAMKAGLFNIGAEGQMYFGGLGLTLAVLAFDHTLVALAPDPAGHAGQRDLRRLVGFPAGLPAGQARQPRGGHDHHVQLHRRQPDELHHREVPDPRGRAESGQPRVRGRALPCRP